LRNWRPLFEELRGLPDALPPSGTLVLEN